MAVFAASACRQAPEPTLAVDGRVEERPVTLTFTTFGGIAELTTLRAQLDRFEERHPDIKVQLDAVPAERISSLLGALAAGGGPDVVRMLDVDAIQPWLLDLRPYLAAPAEFEAAFPPAAMAALRPAGEAAGLYGFPDGYAMTGLFVNRTRFDAAGVVFPSAEADWATWTAAATTVAEQTGARYAIGLDRSGHRFAGGALSLGATMLTADGQLRVDDDGVRAFARQLAAWHEARLTPREVWLADDRANSCIDYFIRGDLVVCASGSWQLSAVAAGVGDGFIWQVAANPVGPGGSAVMASGATIAALRTTAEPESAAALVAFLAEAEPYGEMATAAGVVSARLDGAGATGEGAVDAALALWAQDVPLLTEQALRFDRHPSADAYYELAPAALAAFFAGEVSLDDALADLQAALDATGRSTP